jgi:hypothetical protein
MNPALVSDNDCKPSVEPFTPTLEDREWAENALRGLFDGPSFWDQLSAIAREFRESGDELCRFVGKELDRLVVTARLIGAIGPDDFDVKRDRAENDAREAWEARGFAAGLVAGREECGGFGGKID